MAALVVMLAAMTAVAMPAAAQSDFDPAPGLDVRIDVRYTVEPKLGIVKVRQVNTFANNQVVGGPAYEWTGEELTVPQAVSDVRVWENGVAVSAWVPEDPLSVGESRTFEIRYSMQQGDRLVEALDQFGFVLRAETCCRFVKATLRVVIPSAFDVQAVNPRSSARTFQRAIEGENQTFTLERTQADDSPIQWIAGEFRAVNPNPIGIAVGEGMVTLRSDGAVAWNRRMRDLVIEVARAASAVTGIEWTSTDVVFEHADLDSASVDVWAELQPPLEGTVRLNEAYDPFWLGRAIARPLVPPTPFDDDLLREGLIRSLAADPVQRVTGRISQPSRPRGRNLGPTGEEWLVNQIVDATGWEGMAELLQLGATEETAFVGSGDPETVVGLPGDWRRLLDLGERRLAMDGMRDIIGGTLRAEDDRALLDERNRLVDRHDALAAQAGTTLPLGVRSALSTWDLAVAADLLDAVEETLEALGDAPDLAAPNIFERPDWDQAVSAADLKAYTADYERWHAEVRIWHRREHLDHELGFVVRRGLDWSGADETLDAAEAFVEVGDYASTEYALNSYDQQVKDANDVGVRSLIRFGIGIVAVSVLAIASIVLWRRTRRLLSG